MGYDKERVVKMIVDWLRSGMSEADAWHRIVCEDKMDLTTATELFKEAKFKLSGVEPQSIVDWFEPTDPHHIKGYVHLMETGVWEQGFIPENVSFPINWQVALANKLANAWVNYMKLKYSYF